MQWLLSRGLDLLDEENERHLDKALDAIISGMEHDEQTRDWVVDLARFNDLAEELAGELYVRFPVDAVAAGVPQTESPRKSKRSTERGEGQAKLIAALTKHHKYADGGCLNLSPIGNNELARLAGVSDSTASAFFAEKFGGHTKYRASCANATRLLAALKLLNQAFAPHHLFGTLPPGFGALPSDDDEPEE
jgi:hypothetical protein